MKRSEIQVGVVCGGYSTERDVSLRSAKQVSVALEQLGYGVSVIDPLTHMTDMLSVTVVFNVLHGAYGEDGALQTLLDHYKVPYTGSGVRASVIGMNKVMTKQLMVLNNIPTPSFYVSTQALSQLPAGFSYPVMLKPISGGSSVDMYRVNTDEVLETESRRLMDIYHTFLLESFVQGTEVTVGVINRPNPIALPVLELRPKGEFYDYHCKYTKGMTTFVVPAEISHQETLQCQQLGVQLHQLIGCQGVSRTDIIMGPKGPEILEINTVPGMTEVSDLPAQAAAYGMSYNELVDCMVCDALNRNG